jgi:PAS domain S-box-containing protein
MATILIVDDLAVNRELLVALLRPLGHRLIEAEDGARALAAVAAVRPDLVIADVLMPVMDGYEFARRLREDPATSAIPVVFYTAHYGEREARALALSSGVRDILTKPAEPEEVLRVVDRALSVTATTATLAPLPEFDREHMRLLTDKLSEKVEDLRLTNARLRALVNIGLDLASERDPSQLLINVSNAALELFSAAFVTLGIVDRDTDKIRQVVCAGPIPADWVSPGDTVPGMLRAVTSERRLRRGANASGDAIDLGLPPSHPAVSGYLATPIASPGHVYGWLLLVAADGRAFADEYEQLALALGGLVGRIYENGYFYRVAQRRAEQLEHESRERQLSEDQLRRERDRMRFALQNADVGIWDLDYVTGELRWSERLEAHYGLEPGSFPGTFEAFVSLIHPDDRESVLATVTRAMKDGQDFWIQHRSFGPDGKTRWLNGAGRILLDDSGNPLRGVGISINVTERRNLEAQYQQAQKMEAVGRLAGGVAHDFNNLLTVILGYCELLRSDLDEGDDRQGDLSEIQKAGTSAAALTRQLLAFSRKQIVEPMPIDLNTVVTDLESILRRLIGEDVRVVLSLGKDLAHVMADRGQMEQIVLNLAVNARDAMPTGGTLTIQTQNIDLEEEYVRKHASLQPGSYVALTITDTGTGMTPEVQERLFEPFFTTKEPGKGTGLGLAMVHGIVSGSGGGIRVYSEIARGTAFTVYLPRADKAARQAPPAPAASQGPVAGYTVLVVDDAQGLRDLTRRFLERIGYPAYTAASPEEAIHLFESLPAINVVLTDVVMPRMSGPELVSRLTPLRPALKVIYMSGYTAEAIVNHGVLNHGVALLQKPFTRDALAKKLREVLSSSELRD